MYSPKRDNDAKGRGKGKRVTNETDRVYQSYSARRMYAVSFQLALQAELIARYKSPWLEKVLNN